MYLIYNYGSCSSLLLIASPIVFLRHHRDARFTHLDYSQCFSIYFEKKEKRLGRIFWQFDTLLWGANASLNLSIWAEEYLQFRNFVLLLLPFFRFPPCGMNAAHVRSIKPKDVRTVKLIENVWHPATRWELSLEIVLGKAWPILDALTILSFF